MVSIHSIIIPNVSFSSRLIANLSNKKIGFEVLSLAKIVIRFITRREGRNKKKIRWIILDEEKKKKKNLHEDIELIHVIIFARNNWHWI